MVSCLSIIYVVFVIVFLLNHRSLISGIDLPGARLPKEYHIVNWSGGSLVGSIPLDKDVTLIYGSYGVWGHSKKSGEYNDFSQGLPTSVDRRSIKEVVRARDDAHFFSYGSGEITPKGDTSLPPMPVSLSPGRISLWHFALELHVGRLYGNILGPLTPLFIFFSGLLLTTVLVTGRLLYRGYHRRKKRKRTSGDFSKQA